MSEATDSITLATEPEAATRGRRRVVLQCGSTVYFANGNHAPRAGELMPCLRHGYCGVEQVEALVPRRSASASRTRAPRRTTAELVAHLRGSDGLTVPQLRAARFTLRILTEAAHAGLIAIDAGSGPLVVRAVRDTAAPPRPSGTRAAHG